MAANLVWRNPFRLLLYVQLGLPALVLLLFLAATVVPVNFLGTCAVVAMAASFVAIPLLVLWSGVTLVRQPQARSIRHFAQVTAGVLVAGFFLWFANALLHLC